MKRKEFSFQLYTSNYKESSSLRSNKYVIYFGERPLHKFVENFPSNIKSANQKKRFINKLVKIYNDRRLRRNQLARVRYQKLKQLRELEVPLEEVPLKPTDRYTIKTTRKKARGVFNPKDFVFRHTMLTYNKPVVLSHDDEDERKRIYDLIRADAITVLDRALRLKGGMDWWVIKLITPFYDNAGNLMMSGDLTDQKTGKLYKTTTTYSYGFSVGATRAKNRESLIKHLDFTLSQWNSKLVKDYLDMTSKIEISKILIEQKLSEKAI